MKLAARTSLACWPGLTHIEAIERAMAGPQEPLVGTLLVDHVQVVPQCQGVFDIPTAEAVAATWPATAFRLHANARVCKERVFADLCTFDRNRTWFTAAAQVSQALCAPAYSAHAGRRCEASLSNLFDNARRCADLFNCPVAIEGQYPVGGADTHRYLLSTWEEYAALLASGLPMAVDLSHLNILAHRSGRFEVSLTAELLASPACLEVHVSDNDGSGDHHQVLRHEPWWWALTAHIHPNAVVFSEGNHRRIRPERRAYEPT